MPKNTTSTSTALVPAGQTKSYPIADTTIVATQIFRVPARHPRGDGPWKNEAEKIAWTDATTGYACTILRQVDGTLGGYVGVGADHPLFGFKQDAVPGGLDLTPHGGLDYADTCRKGPEAITVCHPAPSALRKQRPSKADAGAGKDHEPLWWFGFECNKNHDYVPGKNSFHKDLDMENGKTYRDEAYVYGQTTRLAWQLAAIANPERANGVPIDLSASSMPVGLDPERRK